MTLHRKHCLFSEILFLRSSYSNLLFFLGLHAEARWIASRRYMDSFKSRKIRRGIWVVPFCWPGRLVSVDYVIRIMSYLLIFLMPWLLCIFSGMESCHSLSFWWHWYVFIPGCIAQEWKVQNTTSHWIGKWHWTAVASLEMGIILCFRGELYSSSRVCFLLFLM